MPHLLVIWYHLEMETEGAVGINRICILWPYVSNRALPIVKLLYRLINELCEIVKLFRHDDLYEANC
jgi:hypothetical protein